MTLRLTPKTVCRKGGADAAAEAFAPGASVAVITRGLPSGLLMAALVSDAPADAARERALLKPVRLSGHVLDVQPDQNLLTVAALKPKGRRTIAVGPDTRIKVRKEDATLDDLKPGMRVSVRLGRSAGRRRAPAGRQPVRLRRRAASKPQERAEDAVISRHFYYSAGMPPLP